MAFGQCFMCREFSSEAVVRNGTMGIRLCYPCWDDVVQEAARKAEELRGGTAERRARTVPRERPGKSVPLLTPLS